MYTLAAALGLLVTWCTLEMLSGRRAAVVGYAVFAAAGLYVLYYFAFLLVALSGAVMIWLALRRRWRRLGVWLLAQVAVLVLYAPWLPIAWRQAIEPPVPPWRSPSPLLAAVVETWTALTAGQAVPTEPIWPLLAIAGILFGCGVLGAAMQGARRTAGPNPALLLLSLLIGPLALIALASLATPLYHVRYVFTYAPAFYVLLAGGVVYLRQRSGAVAWVAVIAVLAGSVYGLHSQRAAAGSETDDLRAAVRYLAERWRPGDAVLINAGYAYTAFDYYYAAPTAGRLRLTDYRSPADPGAPLVLQTGIIGGAPSLGWGDDRADFYATTAAETTAALARVLTDYPRLWVLRIYDTVADPEGRVRDWLARETIPFEDRSFTGSSYPHVQGFMARRQPPPPPGTSVAFERDVTLVGWHAPTQATAGAALDTVLWWQVTGPSPSESPPRAVSLKLWQPAAGDAPAALVAQADEWPLGSLLLTPAWPRDVPVRHPMRLWLPANLEAGVYRLEVQLYDPATLLPYQRLDGGGNSVFLGEIHVGPDSASREQPASGSL
jgi:hypothetical protein